MLFALLIFSVFGAVLFQCLQPVIVEWLINKVISSQDTFLLAIAISLLSINFLFFCLVFIMRIKILSSMGARIMADIRCQLFSRLQDMDLDEYYKTKTTPLISYFSEHLSLIESTTLFITWSIIGDFFLCISAAAVLFYFDWLITLILLPCVILILSLSRFFFRQTAKETKNKQLVDAEIIDTVQENISMQDVIRLELLKNYRKNLFKSIINESININCRYNLNLGLSSISLLLGVTFSILLIYSLGGVLVFYKVLSMGAFVGFILLFRTFLGAINNISNTLPLIMRCAASFEVIDGLLKTRQTSPRETNLPRIENALAFEEVSFNYNSGMPSLKSLSFKIKAGQFVGIVGLSGSGKSTLLKLILKELKPTTGNIFFDNQNYSNIPQESLLAQTSVVMQEPKLFEGSILKNIEMGKLGASEDEVIQAAKKAGVHEEIIKLPQGYNTMIGRKHSNLSGGQKQRICIARALIANPAILCLDEASSSLDPFSSSLIDQTISELAGLHTIISITHRLGSVVNADSILVMNQGQIIESGNHISLLKQNGFYAQLWNKQQGFTLIPEQGFVKVNPDWLKHIPLIADLDDNTKREIADSMITERWDKGEIVFKQGDPEDKFYIIAIGMVDVFLEKNATEKHIASLSDGDFFGEIGLLYHCERNATVKTNSTCLFLSLSSDAFYKIIHNLPEDKMQNFLEKAYVRLTEEQKTNAYATRFNLKNLD
ncbi:ATP-binding cassette domain-containing protein [Legionella birminghamensis]|nr:ATP-binding cassette domain-containing protein [Legionella birminghamensis]